MWVDIGCGQILRDLGGVARKKMACLLKLLVVLLVVRHD